MAPGTVTSSPTKGKLLTNVDSGIEDYQLDEPPMELSLDGGFAYVLHYHGLAAG